MQNNKDDFRVVIVNILHLFLYDVAIKKPEGGI